MHPFRFYSASTSATENSREEKLHYHQPEWIPSLHTQPQYACVVLYVSIEKE